jgi:uncharacterized protein (TIGR03435 family)
MVRISRWTERMERNKRLFALFAVALTAAVSPLSAAPQPGQASFEVASVRPSPPIQSGQPVFFGPPRGGPGSSDPRRITWTYAALRSIVMTAYNVPTFQVVAPDWLATSRYDIAANVPEGSTSEQVTVMWRNLLEERFGVVVHHESREFQVQELTVAKGGPKLKETDLGANPEPFLPDPGLKPGPNPKMNGFGAIILISPGGKAEMTAKALTMADFVARVSGGLRMPVIDKTGIAGRYDFTLDYSIDLEGNQPQGGPTPAPADDVPDLASAVEKQLGLKLSRAKASLDVIVVDRVNRVPTDN